jgi:hypothetical protein
VSVPQAVRDQVDAALVALWTTVQAREATYVANFGRYAQALYTHATPPADGAVVVPDVGTTIPYYERAVAAWPLAVRQTAYPFRLAVDQYIAPEGAGYVGVVQVLINGTLWERAAQVGPATYLAHGWAPVDGGG